MPAVKPRDGEHPLATTTRKLHRELALAYGFCSAVSLCIGVLFGVAGIEWLAVATLLPICVFGAFAREHWIWSR